MDKNSKNRATCISTWRVGHHRFAGLAGEGTAKRKGRSPVAQLAS